MVLVDFRFEGMTVKMLRESIENLPDDAQVRIAEGIIGRIGSPVKMQSIHHVCDLETGQLYSTKIKQTVPDEARPVLALWI